MKITFAGTVIAQEFSDGGTDAVTGFKPQARSKTQTVDLLRGSYAKTVARGNRVITLSGMVRPAPSPSLDEAMLTLETLYGSLPDSGDLVKTVGGTSVTYPGAVLESFEALEDLNGVSYGFQLHFVAGKPSATVAGATVGTETGLSLGTEAGGAVGTDG